MELYLIQHRTRIIEKASDIPYSVFNFEPITFEEAIKEEIRFLNN